MTLRPLLSILVESSLPTPAEPLITLREANGTGKEIDRNTLEGAMIYNAEFIAKTFTGILGESN